MHTRWFSKPKAASKGTKEDEGKDSATSQVPAGNEAVHATVLAAMRHPLWDKP
jgi:hypothetical protein